MSALYKLSGHRWLTRPHCSDQQVISGQIHWWSQLCERGLTAGQSITHVMMCTVNLAGVDISPGDVPLMPWAHLKWIWWLWASFNFEEKWHWIDVQWVCSGQCGIDDKYYNFYLSLCSQLLDGQFFLSIGKMLSWPYTVIFWSFRSPNLQQIV